MGKHQKSWSAEQKLEIVNYYRQHGMAKTVREFEVSNVSIYNWEKILVESGSEGFTSKSLNKTNPELRKLKRENERLLRIVAEKELVISIQKDLLKKSK